MSFSRFSRAAKSSMVAGLATALLCIGCVSGDESRDAVDRGEEISPLDADVFIADLVRDPAGGLAIGALTNISRRPGYDNQPHFVPDGTGLWYTVIDDHDGQADIWRYDLEGPSVTRVTM